MNQSRKINKIAVLGSGLMGSAIALHLAGSGFEVLLLDLKSDANPNKIAQESLQKSLWVILMMICRKSHLVIGLLK